MKAHDFHLTTGNQCTKYLLESLTEHGHIDAAFRIVTQETYPGWWHMLANGATTIWERWEFAKEGGMHSHNHPMHGAIGAWFFKHLAGIRPDPDAPGFRSFVVSPHFPRELKRAAPRCALSEEKSKSSGSKSKKIASFRDRAPGQRRARNTAASCRVRGCAPARARNDRPWPPRLHLAENAKRRA